MWHGRYGCNGHCLTGEAGPCGLNPYLSWLAAWAPNPYRRSTRGLRPKAQARWAVHTHESHAPHATSGMLCALPCRRAHFLSQPPGLGAAAHAQLGSRPARPKPGVFWKPPFDVTGEGRLLAARASCAITLIHPTQRSRTPPHCGASRRCRQAPPPRCHPRRSGFPLPACRRNRPQLGAGGGS